MNDLGFATVAELAELLRTRQVSSIELTRDCLERLDRIGPKLNAVASLVADRAEREARQADRAIQRGAWRGPLHGVPYGAKDLLAAHGAPTTWGAPPYRDQLLDFDAEVVRRLGRAGAVLAAKLAMVELAGGGGYQYPDASLQGPGLTPWHLDHWSGGSSSGSGSAVAAGLVPYAIGSETSGSIVTPAAYCGVTGLRPTYGLVSRRGAMPLAWTLDKLGPLARTAEDCGLVLGAIAGVDRKDRSTVPAPRHRSAGPAGLLRVGFAPADFEELAAPEARAAFGRAIADLSGLDVEMIEVELPALPYRAMAQTIIAAEGASVHGDLCESPRLNELRDERQKAGLRAALSLPARQYLDAMRARGLVQEGFATLFRRIDVLLSVARSRGATRLDEPVSAPAVPDREAPDRSNMAQLIPAGNLAGLPALAFPCGFDTNGLPVGLQLVGRPFAESVLVDLGSRYQAATDWHRRRPPISGAREADT